MRNQQEVKKEAMAEQKEWRLIEYLSVQTQCHICHDGPNLLRRLLQSRQLQWRFWKSNYNCHNNDINADGYDYDYNAEPGWRYISPVSTAAMTAMLASAATTAVVTLSTASMPTVTMMAMAGYDSTLAPPPFRGNTEDDGEGWLVSGILPLGSPVGNITGKFRTLD